MELLDFVMRRDFTRHSKKGPYPETQLLDVEWF